MLQQGNVGGGGSDSQSSTASISQENDQIEWYVFLEAIQLIHAISLVLM